MSVTCLLQVTENTAHNSMDRENKSAHQQGLREGLCDVDMTQIHAVLPLDLAKVRGP